MRILTTGNGRSGSWQCRGVQLGKATGSITVGARGFECARHEVIVAVKRINEDQIKQLNKSGRPWIWDLVDFYPQPAAGSWTRDWAIQWVRSKIKHATPNGVIYATERMRDDIGIDGITVYHHARPDAVINPIREKIQRVGYEGSQKYLGAFEKEARRICAKKGWEFVATSGATCTLQDLDVVLGVRDKAHRGYVQEHWKSNVKLANAHGTGTPFIGQPDSGYLETKAGGEVWIESPADLETALLSLEPYEVRKQISENFKANIITLKQCAKKVRRYAERLVD